MSTSIAGDNELEAIGAEAIKQYAKKVRLLKKHYSKEGPLEIIVKSKVGKQEYTVHVWTEGNDASAVAKFAIYDTTKKLKLILPGDARFKH